MTQLSFRSNFAKKKTDMKRFFDMIPGKDAACILLYGDIGDYDRVNSGDIARELIEAEAQYGKVDVRINSKGGDIFVGIAIFNVFRNSKADITIYIDGIAASIASVIAACGKPVKMSRYARLMIHSASGGVYGNAEELKEVISRLSSLEDTLCDIYADRCKKPREEIKAEWFDGKDHWFTAEQALELGLVDEIYDADPVPEDSTVEQIYTIFNNRLNKPQNSNQMNFEELRKRPSFANCVNDDDVLRHITHLETEAGKVPTLQNKLTAYEEKEQKAVEEEDDALLDAAVKDERIPESQRATYKALLKADRTNGQAALNALKPKRRVTNSLNQPDGTQEGAWAKRQAEIKNKLNK